LIPFLFSTIRGLTETIAGAALLKLNPLILSANDQIANFGCALPFIVQPFDQETLLKTEPSASAMLCGEAVEQTAMPITIVAMTVTRLLGEDLGDLFRVTVRLDHRRVDKLLRV
jgi:hypothetical protein